MIRLADTESWKQRVQSCTSFREVREVRDTIQPEFQEYLPLSDLAAWMEALNQFHDVLVRQTIMLAERELQKNAGLAVPCPYAFILFGSSGRSERTLWSDQDNGLVYLDDTELAGHYFENFAIAIEEGLQLVGYPPCDGKVSVINQQWRKSLVGWKQQLALWFEESSWESVRHLLIIADARIVHGSEDVMNELKRSFNHHVQTTPKIMEGMLRNTLRHKVVLGPLGNLIREEYGEDAGGFDIKYGAYIPMVNAVRLLAVSRRIPQTSTLARLARLESEIGTQVVKQWKQAFLAILSLRSLTPSQLTEQGYYTTRGKLSSVQLTKEVKGKLKSCIQTGEQLQKFIVKDGLS